MLKRIAEKQLKGQVKMIQMLSSLSINEVREFNQWHKNHPLYKEIPEIINSSRQTLNEENHE